MTQICVDMEFARAILGASYTTAKNHLGKNDEMYALGGLEATANLFYIMAVNSKNTELQEMCHRYAEDSLNRYEELCEDQKVASNLGRGLSG
ncbi:MAG: hypothetical protein JKY67_07540 [Pseudomonadales bacterium]|nr:hypothetical protein [Pseudomonadales bacterium]